MSSINLEVGKYYRARNGEVFGPLTYDGETGTPYKFDGNTTSADGELDYSYWMADGRRSAFDDADCPRDLVEEVPAPCALKAALGEMEAAAQAEQQADNVNRPSHYTAGEIECIDAIRASMSAPEFRGYLRGNVFKYLWRHDRKGGAEDLAKADWYLQRLRQAVA